MRTSWLSRLLDLIAPRRCALCGRRLAPTESVFCGPCHLALPLTGHATHGADNPLARLFWGQLPVERAAALLHYRRQTPVALMIHDMKYHRQPLLARAVGELAARMMQREGFFDGIDVLVPVPLTRRRQWQRGYNQSLQLCRGISDATGIPIARRAVSRRHFSGSQTQLSALDRRDNVSRAFRLERPADVEGRHVLLVDDVITTGATMTACGRELLRAEGVRLSIMAVAAAGISNFS